MISLQQLSCSDFYFSENSSQKSSSITKMWQFFNCPCFSCCHLIGDLLQLADLSGTLLRQIVAQLPNADRPICSPQCQEVRVLAVEGQTSCGLVRTSLLDGGCRPQGPAAQVKYVHLTLDADQQEVRVDTNTSSTVASFSCVYTAQRNERNTAFIRKQKHFIQNKMN